MKNIKLTKTSSGPLKSIITYALAVVALFFAYTMLQKASADIQNTVGVLRVKYKEGLPAYTNINEDNIDSSIEVYKLTAKEYREDMLLAEDIGAIKGSYTLYYLRNKDIITKDSLTYTRPLKNEWLYVMEEGLEALTLSYNYMEAGGDILTPGDKIKVRASFDLEEYDEETGTYNNVRKTEEVFNTIQVQDLLNNSGHSVYEVYKELSSMTGVKRRESMQDRNFLQSILPKSLILVGTPEQALNYAEYKDRDGLVWTITILSRQGNSEVADQLSYIKDEYYNLGTEGAEESN